MEDLRVSGTEVNADSAVEDVFHGDRRRIFFGEGGRDEGWGREMKPGQFFFCIKCAPNRVTPTSDPSYVHSSGPTCTRARCCPPRLSQTVPYGTTSPEDSRGLDRLSVRTGKLQNAQ
jgi:hypothetical protein